MKGLEKNEAKLPHVSDVMHEKVRLFLTIENGKVTYSKHLLEDEFVGSMDTFLWIAERAGYTIIPPTNKQTVQAL
ncbi:hypothetical protein HUK76_22980 [Citrobacter portucalensis]|uniref:hypothetical protein n=1 Tax=Citrobacter portucalensis TaxID=1639133 RepID=UPI0015812269|nr:hypothetical protein [Citrobacter portucalensis]NUH56515.1 hypothetical protein [Citrobacter portucalensis]